jgi:hypothetical protein
MINATDAAATVARVSFRDTWNAVAPTITTARPSAASGVSHVAMLTAPGRISPSDAMISAHVAIVRLTGMFCSASISGDRCAKAQACVSPRRRCDVDSDTLQLFMGILAPLTYLYEIPAGPAWGI